MDENEWLKQQEQERIAYEEEWAFRNQEMAPTPKDDPAVIPWTMHAILGLIALFGFWPGVDFLPSMGLVALHVLGIWLAANGRAFGSFVLLLLMAAGAMWWLR